MRLPYSSFPHCLRRLSTSLRFRKFLVCSKLDQIEPSSRAQRQKFSVFRAIWRRRGWTKTFKCTMSVTKNSCAEDMIVTSYHKLALYFLSMGEVSLLALVVALAIIECKVLTCDCGICFTLCSRRKTTCTTPRNERSCTKQRNMCEDCTNNFRMIPWGVWFCFCTVTTSRPKPH